MHCYGDEDFHYWRELELAAEYIGDFCKKWGRIQVYQCKEKFGTVRVYCSLHCQSLHDFFWPGYCWIHTLFPNDVYCPYDNRNILQKFLYSVSYNFWTFRVFKPFEFLVYPYQKFIYRLAYKNAVKKWPMIKEEILCGADWKEYLKGVK